MKELLILNGISQTIALFQKILTILDVLMKVINLREFEKILIKVVQIFVNSHFMYGNYKLWMN